MWASEIKLPDATEVEVEVVSRDEVACDFVSKWHHCSA